MKEISMTQGSIYKGYYFLWKIKRKLKELPKINKLLTKGNLFIGSGILILMGWMAFILIIVFYPNILKFQ